MYVSLQSVGYETDSYLAVNREIYQDYSWLKNFA